MKATFVIVLSLLMMGGAARAQTTVSGSGSISLALQLSRTSGVAPLMVFFDATGTTDPGVTSRPFRELEYHWNFGDADLRWNRGSRAGASRKNTATGPVTAHVYENPGTYTATLTVFDGRYTLTRKVSVTVTDPAVVFAGARTVCFSNGQLGYEGCPAGAERVKTADFSAAINGYRGSGKRLLFRRGETFSSFKPAIIGVDGPGIVGAYGPLTDPRPVLWNTANGNTLQFSGYKTPKVRDWRVMDLSLLGSGLNQSYGIALVGGMDQLTFLRLSIRRQRVAVMADSNILDHWNKQASTAGHRIWDQLALVDSDVSEVNHAVFAGDKGYGTYLSGDRLFFAGNLMDNTGTAVPDVSHVARFTYLAKAVISNNTLMNPGPTEHVIKIHAPAWGAPTTEHDGLGGGYTRWVVIADNKIVGANNPWLLAVGPQNGSRDERVLEVISERNWFVAGPGMQVAQMFWASAVTVRNNIVDASLGSQWQTGLAVGRRGIEPRPERISVYHETYYTTRKLDRGHFVGINLAPSAWNVTAENNLAYAPNALNPVMFRNDCGACLAQSNNSTDTLIATRLPFVATAPATPPDFVAAGYAIGNGRPVPTWSDFFLAIQTTQRRDMGAVFH